MSTDIGLQHPIDVCTLLY